MRLASKIGNNEHVYRISKLVQEKDSQPFIIKTLLKDNLSFAEKKEILEQINFSKNDTLIQDGVLNVYNSALLNVPVYTNEIQVHRNEFAKPDSDLDDLMLFIFSKNPVNFNKINYSNNDSILKMLVVFGLSKTLNAALSIMDMDEKEKFLNNTYVDTNILNLCSLNVFGSTKSDNVMLSVLPVLGNNMETLRVMCQHGLDTNKVNDNNKRGLGFYLYSKSMITELEEKYGFDYNLNQKDIEGNVLKDILKNNDRDNDLSVIKNLYAPLKNEITGFIDERITLLKLTDDEMCELIIKSYSADNITNFKKVYNEFAPKINYKLPGTDVNLLEFFSCKIDYPHDACFGKLMHIKKDFEARKSFVDESLFLFSVITSDVHRLKENMQDKIKKMYEKDKSIFCDNNLLKQFIKSYKLLDKLFKSKKAIYTEKLEVLTNFDNIKKILGVNYFDEARSDKIKINDYAQDFKDISHIAIIYNLIAFNELLRFINLSNLQDIDEMNNAKIFASNIEKYYKASNKNDNLSHSYLTSISKYLKGDLEFLNYLVESLESGCSVNYSLKKVCEEDEVKTIVEKIMIEKSLNENQSFSKSIKAKRI